MHTLPPIKELVPNVSGVAFYLCCRKEVRQGRSGDFIALTLQDRTGPITARVFDNVDALKHEFDEGEFVKVQGRTQLYGGRVQLVVERIRRVMDGDRTQGFREEECVACAPRPVDEMWAELLDLATVRVSNPFVRALLHHVLSTHEPRLKAWPAAMTVHHAYRGGFLEHVLQVVTVSRTLADLYGADVDVVTAGAVLHDIGKLRELSYELATSYSRDGNLVGHITLGAMMVHDACAAVPGFPDGLRAHIEHLVVSHHGDREFGSPVVPMTVEAFILSMADDLDAKIHQVRYATATDAGEGEFTGYHSRLERVLWKGARDAPVNQ
jgi:3'-5' exoribonuclease